MTYQRLPESQLTLYAELLDQSIQLSETEAVSGVLKGSFISKKIKGRTYCYLQKSQGQKKHQIYLGPESPSLLDWIDRAKTSTATLEVDRRNLSNISKMLAAGGATTEPSPILRALLLLSDSPRGHLEARPGVLDRA